MRAEIGQRGLYKFIFMNIYQPNPGDPTMFNLFGGDKS